MISTRVFLLPQQVGLQHRITPDTRIFSPQTVPRLCVAIGHQVNESKRLTALPAARFCRFEHIVPNSSGKVVAK
jgi:hypothetical protein